MFGDDELHEMDELEADASVGVVDAASIGDESEIGACNDMIDIEFNMSDCHDCSIRTADTPGPDDDAGAGSRFISTNVACDPDDGGDVGD